MPRIPAARVPRNFTWRDGLRLIVLSLLLAAAYGLAYAIPSNFTLVAERGRAFLLTLPMVVGIKLVVALLTRSIHGWVRYVSFHDLLTLLRTALIASLVVVAVNLFLSPALRIPWAVIALDFGITVLFVGGMRSAGRFTQEQFWPLVNMHMLRRKNYRRVLLVGADRTGAVLVHQIHFHPTLKYRVVGFLDPDPSLHGCRLAGVPVLGDLDDACRIAAERRAQDILVLAGSVAGHRMRRLMEQCERAEVRLKVIANVHDLVSGRSRAGQQGVRLRSVNINDLLRREPHELDDRALDELLRQRVIMVTGAGGSIGAEICRQVLARGPRNLVLLERAENNLFEIERELQSHCGPGVLRAFLADITDAQRLRDVFEACPPQVVFHAAAHKHVALTEQNPGEAIKNNVFGTRLVADLAAEHGVDRFVFISTDKAVNPSGVMGLSKQIAEHYVQAISGQSPTRFVTVRFGNVLGSTGSVVPIFEEQIANGGPLTITHPEMQRYFMTIPEASQLVLQAAAMGRGGEVFVLDMGEPVKIVDLAQDLIRVSGFAPHEIPIVFTGLRPGEKLFEELYFDEERTMLTSHAKLRVAYPRPCTGDEMSQLLRELRELTAGHDADAIRHGLQQMFPGFQKPESTGQAESSVAP